MGKIVVSEFVSLDGVMEDPGGSEGTRYGGWTFPFGSPEQEQFKAQELVKADALLLGRRTYEGFAAAWPTMEGTGAYGEKMNSIPKYVVSTTLSEPTWNASVLKGDLAEELPQLKRQINQDILIFGSNQLVHSLIEQNLIDEYRLMVFPDSNSKNRSSTMTTSDNSAPRPGERQLVITRIFDAPRELVWKAFTEADRLAQWWGPKGFTMLVRTLDFRPGGVFLYAMRAPDGHTMWGRFVYRDILTPERMVFVSSFTDESGAIIRAPFSSTWPLEILNVATFTESGGKTAVTLRGGPVNASEEERATFWNSQDSVEQGFAGTFDQLAAYLAEAQR